MANSSDFQAKLKVLSDTYAAQLPEKLRQLALAWSKLPQHGWDEDQFYKFFRMVHGFTGAGKTFGFSALSESARKLENHLKPLGETKALKPEQRTRIKHLLDELNQSALRRDGTVTAKSEWSPVTLIRHKPFVSRHVFVVEDNHALANELKIQLSYFDYKVDVFNTLNDFRTTMQQNPNVVILMDINFPEDDRGGLHVMAELQQGRDVLLPVVFLSALSDLDVRLDAVRVGALAYLHKPVNIGALVDTLDGITSNQSPAAFRVLIVDDAVHLTNFYTSVLEQAGMSVKVVNNPLEVMKPLLEFAPDLILIDMYMPECSGMELAAVIRQLNTFVGIPIVFLSAESNLDKQLVALGLGGDDFLTKPIEPAHLVAALTNRIKRSQVLRSFMVRDSLTGLINHTAIKDQLSHEMARAKRQGKPLSFAMIDIDHFKAVNDTYGHPVGDRVIKSIARLLKQRLRENDLVGRYGGEEFAVILVDTDARSAMKILDNIRNDFSQLLHVTDDQEFYATFSGGIADISNFSDASKLTDTADKALYKAKHAGRNRVMLSDGSGNF